MVLSISLLEIYYRHNRARLFSSEGYVAIATVYRPAQVRVSRTSLYNSQRDSRLFNLASITSLCALRVRL